MVESEANKVDPMEVKGCSGERDGTNGVIVESTHRGRMEKWCFVVLFGVTAERRTQGGIGQTWIDRRLIGAIE